MNRTVLAAVWPPTASAAAAAGHRPASPIEAIRRKCIDCSGGQVSEVRSCEAVACALWPFRAGRHAYAKRALQAAGSGARAADGIPGGVNAARAEIPVHEASFAESAAFLAPVMIKEDR
jgi:hypothetical protein